MAKKRFSIAGLLSWKGLLFLSILGVLFSLQACERDIEIDLPLDENYLVAEGWIEAGEAPKVIVSRNRGFFDTFPGNLQEFIDQFIVKDAQVIIDDGTHSYTLEFTVDPFHFPYVYYTSDQLSGEVGKRYTLKIVAEGKQLSAVTVVPPKIALDTVYFRPNMVNNQEDSLGFVFLRLSDPDTTGNGYRVYARRNQEPDFYPVEAMTFNDEFVNGLTFDFFTQQSKKPFAKDTFVKEDFYYQKGDTVYLKFCTMGWEEVDFFRTFEVARNSNGNPFATPMLIKSNIKGGLGVWYGMAASYDTLITH